MHKLMEVMSGRSGVLAVATMLAGALVAGCERQAPAPATPSATEAQESAATVREGLFVADAPADARAVADVKGDADATGEVVIRGRVGGRKEPFVAGAAVFLLADVSMKACNELHGDSCQTPWDYCCEPRDSLAAKVATIQVLDASGKPLRVELNGAGGLKPLAEVTVMGTIAPRVGTDTLVINAEQIHVDSGGV